MRYCRHGRVPRGAADAREERDELGIAFVIFTYQAEGHPLELQNNGRHE